MTSVSFTATLKCMIQTLKDEQAGSSTAVTKSAAEDNLSMKTALTAEEVLTTHQYDVTIGLKHNSFISAKEIEEIVIIDRDESDSEVKCNTEHNSRTSFCDNNAVDKYILSSTSKVSNSQRAPSSVQSKCSLRGTVTLADTHSNKNFRLRNTSAFDSTKKDELKQKTISPKVRIRENPVENRSFEINSRGCKKLKHDAQSSIKKTPVSKTSCAYCSKPFKTQYGLVKHNKFHCLLQNTFSISCKICNSVYADPATLNSHIRNVHGIINRRKMSYYVKNSTLIPGENSVSKVIPKVATSSSVTKSAPVGERSCAYCSKSFKTQSGLVKHNKFHCLLQNTYNISCKICNSVYADPATLNNHIRKAHGITDRRRMSYYVANSTLILAEKSVSKVIPKIATNYSVTKRNQQSRSRKIISPSAVTIENDVVYLNKREKTARGRKVLRNSKRHIHCCKFCKKIFSSLFSLRYHLDYLCLVHKRYEFMCTICNGKFAGKKSIREHILRKHGIRLATVRKTCAYIVKFKIFKSMKKANRNLSQKGRAHEQKPSVELKRNESAMASDDMSVSAAPMNSKSCDKQFKCNTCFKLFAKQNSLNAHSRFCRNIAKKVTNILKTRGTKVYYCKYCKKGLSSLNSLTVHLNFNCTIRKRNILVCRICNREFSGIRIIRAHILRTHGITIATARKQSDYIINLKTFNSRKSADCILSKEGRAYEQKSYVEYKRNESVIIADDMSVPFVTTERPNDSFMTKEEITDSAEMLTNSNSNEKKVSEEKMFGDFSRIEPVIVLDDSNESVTSCNTLSQGMQFKCNHCFKSFTEECALDAHSHFCQGALVDGESFIENQDSQVFCNVCDEKYFSLAKLIQHLQDHLISE